MTIDRLAELYLKGYYSKIDFYLALLNILAQAEDPEYVLERVPPRLVEFVVGKARDHDLSAGRANRAEEQRLPQTILRWHDQHLARASSDSASRPTTVSETP